MSHAVTARAPAKLNLALSVGPPREDGYHPICSWMVTIDLYDDLEVRRLAADRLSRYAILWHEEAPRRRPIDWSITKDLAVQAHLALERRAGRRLPVQLKLEKRIPVGGGLGGGSANAAAMLHAVNELYDLGFDVDELAAVGASIGADVPFLVHGGSAIVEGVGDLIEQRGEMPEVHAVLVFPDAACPTAGIYGRFDEDGAAALRAAEVRTLADAARGGAPTTGLFNDLAAAAMEHAPAVADAPERLSALAERDAHVSGSGSTVFVVCDDALHAEHLARAFMEATDLPARAVSTVRRIEVAATRPA